MTQLTAIIDNKGVIDEYSISACGIEGRIFRTEPGMDRWSLQVGGFYNWHATLDTVVKQSEEVFIRMATHRVISRFKQLRRDINKKRKQNVL